MDPLSAAPQLPCSALLHPDDRNHTGTLRLYLVLASTLQLLSAGQIILEQPERYPLSRVALHLAFVGCERRPCFARVSFFAIVVRSAGKKVFFARPKVYVPVDIYLWLARRAGRAVPWARTARRRGAAGRRFRGRRRPSGTASARARRRAPTRARRPCRGAVARVCGWHGLQISFVIAAVRSARSGHRLSGGIEALSPRTLDVGRKFGRRRRPSLVRIGAAVGVGRCSCCCCCSCRIGGNANIAATTVPSGPLPSSFVPQAVPLPQNCRCVCGGAIAIAIAIAG